MYLTFSFHVGYLAILFVAHSYVASTKDFSSWMKRDIAEHYNRITELRGVNSTKQETQDVVDEFSRRIREPKRVAILGAGIQGCLMALMFRKHGYDVTGTYRICLWKSFWTTFSEKMIP